MIIIKTFKIRSYGKNKQRQKENSNLRLNDEKQRLDLNAIEKQRDNYRDKFQEQKNKNDYDNYYSNDCIITNT